MATRRGEPPHGHFAPVESPILARLQESLVRPSKKWYNKDPSLWRCLAISSPSTSRGFLLDCPRTTPYLGGELGATPYFSRLAPLPV